MDILTRYGQTYDDRQHGTITEDKMKRTNEGRVPNSNAVAATLIVGGVMSSQIDHLGYS